ncbi:putative nucleic acid-binding protein, contains PIN domain [Abditibacterium utsteinense]|uniref:Putative nucleic acid-binding protein, contains PIN domain n=1 Tax=Abditibacterium utsteinense TaxID=1960156 RepID=A0A2S8SPL7_9BACT|nr:type II toxin-antitoxin system VapC family toxin [Abditibacterium utsteinense]PQV62745.1 putative nucleic acid-binding protein, contains PIN domain [Abditibacterium utsteinense]
MSLYEDAMSLAVQLPQHQREHLAQALGLKLAPRATLPMAMNAPDRSKTDPAAWRASETGHAVLDVNRTSAPVDPNLVGVEALRGLFAHKNFAPDESLAPDTLSSLPLGSPVVLHTSAVIALALDLEITRTFWEKPPVEIRIATATYLKLLELCADESERSRVRAFVQPFAVLSLGPMASTKAAQLMLENPAPGLSALDALIAATAIAHEIPLVTRDAAPFANIEELSVATLP